MKLLASILAFGLLTSVSVIAQPQNLASCSPMNYRSLVVDTSTRADVLRLLGKPEAVAREEDTGTPYWSYTVNDPKPGWLMVFLRKDKLSGIRLIFKNPLGREEIVRLFGPDFLTVHYAFDDCRPNGGAGQVYLSPTGPIENWEYRGQGKGVVISVHNGQAIEVEFACGPVGSTLSRCTAPQTKAGTLHKMVRNRH